MNATALEPNHNSLVLHIPLLHKAVISNKIVIKAHYLVLFFPIVPMDLSTMLHALNYHIVLEIGGARNVTLKITLSCK